MTGAWTNTRNLGSTGLEVTSVCVGGSPLGSMPHLYGYEVSAEQAVAAVEAVFDGPFNFLDTSNAYSDGDSERRIGEVTTPVVPRISPITAARTFLTTAP
jgi:aryl-alcohol dehydrogenase-like predicted oxidoreductase